jgi:hypothetical protein
MVGEGNSGLTMSASMLREVFGKFIGMFSAGNLVDPGKGDQAKLKSWMVHLIQARMGNCDEFPENNDFCIDGGLCKGFASGGGTITGRQNYKDEIEFKLMLTAFMWLNSVPRIQGFSQMLRNRIRLIRAPNKYLEGELYEKALAAKQKNVFKGDENIKDVFCLRKDVQEAYASIILNAYGPRMNVPESMQQELDKWLACEDTAEILRDIYEPGRFPVYENNPHGVQHMVLYKEIKRQVLEVNPHAYLNDVRFRAMLDDLGFELVRGDDGKASNVSIDGERGKARYARLRPTYDE